VHKASAGEDMIKLGNEELFSREDKQTLDTRSMYIDLIKRCVLNIPYVDAELNPIQPYGSLRKAILTVFKSANIQLAHLRRGNYERRIAGHDFSDIAHSMLSLKRLDNVQMCVETILRDNIAGDLIETGVMRGGTVILMRAILRAYGVRDRTVWAADSFEGLPPPNPKDYPADAGAAWHLRPLTEAGVEHVRRNFERYDLLDDQVKFLPGWFRDTLPKAPIKRLAVLRLDGDLYESTMGALVPLYPKVTSGGFVIVDDYNLSMCREAVHDYRQRMGINEDIIPIDDAGVYWRKAAEAVAKS
jgi:O-methyltransferase